MELITENGEIKKAYGYDEAVLSVPEGITRLCEGIFSSFIYLEHITLPDGLKRIDEHVFNNCVKLKEMYIPDSVEIIGEYAFQYCLEMASLHLPEGLKRIENCTFRHCAALKEVTLPKGVEFVDYDAFFGCEKMESFIALNSECEFGRKAFYNCKALSFFDAPRGLARLDELQLARACARYCGEPEKYSEASRAEYKRLLAAPSKIFMDIICAADDNRALAAVTEGFLENASADAFIETAREHRANKCLSALIEYKNKSGIGGIDAMMDELTI